jgi:hypothetical protein
MEKINEVRSSTAVRYVTASLRPSEAPSTEGESVDIAYGSSYNVNYLYDAVKQIYLRSINGKARTDRESGEQYFARRVILRYNQHTPVPDTDLTDIYLEGSGTAVLYEHGFKYELRWQKNGSYTRYFFKDGSEVSLDYGPTWVQVLKP